MSKNKGASFPRLFLKSARWGHNGLQGGTAGINCRPQWSRCFSQCLDTWVMPKRQRTGALQNLADFSSGIGEREGKKILPLAGMILALPFIISLWVADFAGGTELLHAQALGDFVPFGFS